MNKFTAIGVYESGRLLFITSEKADQQLMNEVIRTMYNGATYCIVEGHAKPVNKHIYMVSQLLPVVKSHLNWMTKCSVPSSENKDKINRLEQYIAAAEA